MSRFTVTGGKVRIKDLRGFLRSLNNVAARHGVKAQALNAAFIAGRGHLDFAVEKALNSFEEGRALARDIGMEILLYMRGRRQIEKALEMGVREGDNDVAIVLVGEGADKALDDVQRLLDVVDPSVIDYSHSKDDALMRLFEITPEEAIIVGAERIPLLVRERSALLEFEK